jgi:hypothetical protein
MFGGFGRHHRRHHRRHRGIGTPLVYRNGARGFDVEDVAVGLGIGATMAYIAGRNNNTQAQPYRAPVHQVTTAHLPPGTRMMTVTVPPGVSPGGNMQVNVDGRILNVTVPHGVYSGMKFQFAAPSVAQQQMQPAMQYQQQQPQQHGITLNVKCPPGIHPGQNIVIQTGQGPMTVCVPQGVSPGSEFKVIVPQSTSSTPSGYTPINMRQSAPPVVRLNNNTANNYRGPKNISVLPESRWHQDKLYARCEQCARSFNLLIRKHHCRYCGRVLCDTCSSLKVKNLRACQSCFQKAYPPTSTTTGFGNNMRVLQQQQQPMMSQHATVVQASAPPLPPPAMTNRTISNNNVPVMQQQQQQHPMMSQHATFGQASAPPLPPATMSGNVQTQYGNNSNNLVKTDLINSATELRRRSFGGNGSQDYTNDGNNNNGEDDKNNQLKVSNQPSSLMTNNDNNQNELKNEAQYAVAMDNQGKSEQHAQNVLVTATAVPVTNQQNVDQNLVVVNAVALDHNNLTAPTTNTAPVGNNAVMQNNMTCNLTANNSPRTVNQNSGNGW